MEEVAAFVFGSGGAVSVTELQGFFLRHRRVESAVYAAAAPVRQLKKIVRLTGATHGLAWLDAEYAADFAAGPCVVHNLTDAQRLVFPSTVKQRIPLALDALEALLRATPGGRLMTGELARVYTALPEETAFMHARCGSVAAFVAAYDPDATRIGVSATELWLVRANDKHASPSTTATANPSETQSEPDAEPGESGDEEAREEDRYGLVVANSDVPAVVVAGELPPRTVLWALHVAWAAFSQCRVARPRTSLSASELLWQLGRLVLLRRPWSSMTTRRITTATTLTSQVTPRHRRPRHRARSSHSPSRHAEPLPPPHRRRLLVPDAARGLVWA